MKVRKGCNVGGESSIGRGRGEYTSGSNFQLTEIFYTNRQCLTSVRKDRSNSSLIDAAFRLKKHEKPVGL